MDSEREKKNYGFRSLDTTLYYIHLSYKTKDMLQSSSMKSQMNWSSNPASGSYQLRDHKEITEPLWDLISLSAKTEATSLQTNGQNANKLSDKI